jgi:Single-strand binding protein family
MWSENARSDGKYVRPALATVNVVVLAGTVAADPVQRRMPSGDEVTELRLSVPEAGRRLRPLPVGAWHVTVGAPSIRSDYSQRYRPLFGARSVSVPAAMT